VVWPDADVRGPHFQDFDALAAVASGADNRAMQTTRGAQARYEWQRRVSFPVLILAFGVLGSAAAALFIATGNSVGRLAQAVFGLLLYMAADQYFQIAPQLATSTTVAPWVLLWIPAMVLPAAAITMALLARRISWARSTPGTESAWAAAFPTLSARDIALAALLWGLVLLQLEIVVVGVAVAPDVVVRVTLAGLLVAVTFAFVMSRARFLHASVVPRRMVRWAAIVCVSLAPVIGVAAYRFASGTASSGQSAAGALARSADWQRGGIQAAWNSGRPGLQGFVLARLAESERPDLLPDGVLQRMPLERESLDPAVELLVKTGVRSEAYATQLLPLLEAEAFSFAWQGCLAVRYLAGDERNRPQVAARLGESLG
jgi:hypothetical protein